MGTRTGTYYTGTIDGTVGSLITALDAILVTGEGWTKLYSGTNKAVYQTAAGNGFVLRVVDDGSLAAGAREAIVRAAESATDVDTLVDAFPSVALQADANHVWRKSDSADATARTYHAVADDRIIVLTVRFGASSWDNYVFGDIEPYWAGDTYATIMIARSLGNSGLQGLGFNAAAQTIDTAAATAPVWFARRPSGASKIDRGAIIRSFVSVFGNFGGAALDYPHPETTKLHFKPTLVRSNGTTGGTPVAGGLLRGAIPYLFEFLHGTNVSSLAVGDTFTDSAYDASSQFMVFSMSNVFSDTTAARWILQTAGTWDAGV